VKTLQPSDTITFGKYKGKTLNEIAELDAGYIVWLDEEIKSIKIDTDFVSQCLREELECRSAAMDIIKEYWYD
jgi:hypothetical protein